MAFRISCGRFSHALCTYGALVLVFGVFAASCAGAQETASAQPPTQAATNPYAGDAAAAKRGSQIYRLECVFCHGPGARGGAKGPDLTSGNWIHGSSDAALKRNINEGIPGTAMPPHKFEERELWEVVTYLRSVQVQTPPSTRGDAAKGEKLFFGDGNCSLCHMVNGRGGRVGPELSRIGAARPRTHLLESIREPSKQFSDRAGPFESPFPLNTVKVVTRDGKSVEGVPINEDTFTIQLIDAAENYYSFDKSKLKSFKRENKSLMPPYGDDMLSNADLDDLLAYLQSLRGKPRAAEVNFAK